jgi:hypothetical protein
MACNNDIDDRDYQMETQAVSSDRPPQFNEVNCGYRCGEGCCEPQGGDDEGGGGRDYQTDATPTLIDSDDGIDELDDPFPFENFEEPNPIGPGAHVWEDGDLGSTVFRDNSDETLQVHVHGFAQEDLSSASVIGWVHDDSLDSFQGGFLTRSHSSAASDTGNVEDMSLSGFLDGIGACFDEHQASPFPGFFCRMPLRLSPHYEDCRGHPFQDYSALLGPAAHARGVPRVATGYAFHRDAE